MKTIGIASHSDEGGALCFITACREGAVQLGPHMHPTIVMSAVPMALSMPGWEARDHSAVANYLTMGIEQVAAAGADFYICPDNTAHIVLEQISEGLPIPGLHIAEVVCTEIVKNGWTRVGLLGTEWTMTGPVYANKLHALALERLIPGTAMRQALHNAIFEELCQGVFQDTTVETFVQAISELKADGAECVILGCTEIPLIIDAANSPLPILDSTRLLAKYATMEAIKSDRSTTQRGWISLAGR